MTPLVSILIPAFNAERWLADTIKAALGQTWPRTEIIVVDDGSSDGTLAVARQFSSSTVRVLTQANSGAAAARNRAFECCQGDYIQWLDADDFLGPDKIARQVKAIDDGSLGKRSLLSGAWGYFLHRVGSARFCPSPLWCNLTPIEWLLRKMEHDAFMAIESWLVSRELTELAGPWDTRLSRDDDGEYFSRVLLASDGTRFVPEAKSYYRMSGSGSLSHPSGSPRKLESLFLSFTRQIGYLLAREDSERSRAACLAYLQEHFVDFYHETPNFVPQLQQLASTLGGGLEAPKLSWKYAWIQKSLGWTAAKRTNLLYNRMKWSFMRSWDRALLLMDRESGI
jgi:glycosyltransferase involved in cell wall biosynthesis